jgi:hypothetical protein
MAELKVTEGGCFCRCDSPECGREFWTYAPIYCRQCDSLMCGVCLDKLEKRGSYSADADYEGGSWRNLSYWRDCFFCEGKRIR